MTYAELAAKVRALSDHLIEHGVKRGERVAILSESLPEWAVVFFAAVRSGATVVPLDTKSTVAELRSIVADAGPSLIFASSQHLSIAGELKSELSQSGKIVLLDGGGESGGFQSIEQLRASELQEGITREIDETALIVYTSGTTGAPKGVMVSFNKLAGGHWLENGQTSLSGSLLALYRRLDQLFLRWAADYKAAEYRFPALIPAKELAKLDYFRSFPHLVTFAATLDGAEENLKQFAESGPLNSEGEIRLTAQAPIRDVLTPAACYHFYIRFQGETLAAPRYVTTRATCFRREAFYSPLERQWSFSMREIVCLGTSEEVKTFITECQSKVERFFKDIQLPVE